MIIEISKQRFDALIFSARSPKYTVLEEVAWFSDKNEHFLATIVIDKFDRDCGFVIFARNEKHIFNCIDIGHSYTRIRNAKKEMCRKIYEYVSTEEHIHPQGDCIFEKQDIFKPLVEEKKLHKSFLILRDSEGQTPAKGIIQEIALAFVDCDGFFFKRFQTTEFDQRLWELYLYAYLHEEKFEIINQYSSPDYVCKKDNVDICIEATTVNPAEDDGNRKAYTDPMFKHNAEYNCIKFARRLIRKLQNKYWEKPHVRGNPFIIAIQSFEDLVDSSSLATYVYGLNYSGEKIEYHEHQGRRIKSGFFNMPNCEYISAVLFSNSGTISKFNRMGKLAGFGSKRVTLIRQGTCVNHELNAARPLKFSVEVTPEKYSETWGQGLGMLHNPNALHPIDPNLFPGIEHLFLENGQVRCVSLNTFIPFNSVTFTIVAK